MSVSSRASNDSPTLTSHHLASPTLTGDVSGRVGRSLSSDPLSARSSSSSVSSLDSGGGLSNTTSPNIGYRASGLSKDTSPASFSRSLHGSHLLPSHLASYSPNMGASPGVGVRRLAEQFLNSITDDSPAVRPRRIGLGKHTTVVPTSVHVPTQAAELDKFASTKTLRERDRLTRDEPAASGEGERKVAARQDDDRHAHHGEKKTHEDSVSLKVPPVTVPVSSAPSLLHPNTPAVAHAEDDFAQLHADIASFANSCAEDTQNQKRLREELVQRTQWSIRCVWPTAQVDLVGSVAAGVCLPRSDLDFVIYFPPSNSPPPSYSYATTPANSQGAGTQTHYTYTTSTQAPVVGIPGESNEGEGENAEVAPGESSEGVPTVRHFAHAGTLIKLIGGRKKSKLLFRSTKIQVFKDINLIRMRDGCSGISMDLWFPVDPEMLTRSQQHTMLIQKMQNDFPHSFYPLAIVLKSFMAQNLLNSGYSGLGSYGVLLMLIRYLQYERFNASKDHRDEESNLGRLLVGFFRLYATFDYIHHAIDVVNIGPDGDFITKPPVFIVKRVKRPVCPPSDAAKKSRKKRSEDSDEEEEDEAGGANDADADEPHEEERESASLKKKRSNAADRFTLLILDPMDAQNQIICHHKALRNMIGAFIRAIMILDPDEPAPPLMLPPMPIVLDTTGVTPALVATGPGVVIGDGSAPPSAPNTPPLVPQPIQSLPPFPGLTSTASNTNATRFHRLIEVNTARLGPQTKPCLSAQCANPDGTSKTLCPIQNKVCFTCGHIFIKAAGSGEGRSSAGKGQAGSAAQLNGDGGVGAAASGGSPARTSGASSSAQHRSPPLHSHHQRNYLRPRTPMPPHQQLYSPQSMMAQQLLAAQQSAAAAAVGASAATSPLMFYNLNTNQMESYQAPLGAQAGAPLGFIPVMAYPQQYPAVTDSQQQQQMANMMMQQMQVSQQQQQQQQQYPTFVPQSASYSSMYGQSGGASDLSAYMATSYVPSLSYDYSPTYTTRTLTDPQLVAQPPSPPTNVRTASGGRGSANGGNGKGNSSRANHSFNHQARMQQQAQANGYQAYQPQASYVYQ